MGSQEGCTCCCVLLVDEVYPSVRRIAPLSAWNSCRCVISLLLLSLLGLRYVGLSRVSLSVYEVFILCFNESGYKFAYEPNRGDFGKKWLLWLVMSQWSGSGWCPCLMLCQLYWLAAGRHCLLLVAFRLRAINAVSARRCSTLCRIKINLTFRYGPSS